MNEVLEKTDPVVRHSLLVILERYRSKRNTSHQQSGTQQPRQIANSEIRNPFQIEATRKLTMSNDIERALSKNEFEMYYQPICQLPARTVNGYEALIRWNHPARGLVSPLDFLHLAEQTGQIREIGLWTLEHACRDWSTLRKYSNSSLPFISVNMSPSQLTSDSLVENIKLILTHYDILPTELKLELTETVIINKPDIALRLLNKITDLGCTLAIDDFGTGHSSLETLNRYPIGTMKIDRSLTNTMLTSAHSREIVNSSIQLAHSMNMDVVAEGIETETELSTLIELGCDFGQGWLLGKPSRLIGIPELQRIV